MAEGAPLVIAETTGDAEADEIRVTQQLLRPDRGLHPAAPRAVARAASHLGRDWRREATLPMKSRARLALRLRLAGRRQRPRPPPGAPAAASSGHEARIFAPSSRADVDFDTARLLPDRQPDRDPGQRLGGAHHAQLPPRQPGRGDRRAGALRRPPLPRAADAGAADDDAADVARPPTSARFTRSRSPTSATTTAGRWLQPYLAHLHRGIAVSEPARDFFNRTSPISRCA